MSDIKERHSIANGPASCNSFMLLQAAESIKGTLLRRLNFSCVWSRLNEHDLHYKFVSERAADFKTIL